MCGDVGDGGDNRRIGGFGKFWLSQGPKNNTHFSLSPLSSCLCPTPVVFTI
jgi:hypothetical protein